jgi:predicted NAD-dependent protein-ADP-ribosyltransferase YbiA (DUF1768 family)
MKKFLTIGSFFLLFTSCISTAMSTGQDGYPDHWWREVPKDQLASWEISPHLANRQNKEVILSKRNELGKLSNFEPAPFQLDGESYASIEGLWQSLKYPENEKDERNQSSVSWPYSRQQVMAMSSFEAKNAGSVASQNMKKLGIKWVTYKGQKIDYGGVDQAKHYDIILRASRAKLQAHPEIKEILKSTGGLKLLPDHKTNPDSPPAYHYYDIYMKLRSE